MRERSAGALAMVSGKLGVSDKDGVGYPCSVRVRFARTPAAGSKTKTREACSRLTGSLGLISVVRKMRKDAWGVDESSFFSMRTR